MKQFLTIILLSGFMFSLFAQANFNTSLHKTRAGKEYAYKKENGGMELLTNIPMSQLTCQKCHSTTGFYPNGDPIDPNTYTPSCNDCHNFAAGNTVAEQTCINCHNRQKYERTAYPNTDAHQLAGLTCVNCHSKAELHGDDGVAYNSLYEDGAIKVKCEDCHINLPSNTSHTVHASKVDCAACHAVSILTCASCHFESLLATGKNRAINQILNFRLLVKKNDKIGLGSFMTHTYDGKTNLIVNGYHSHIITKNATTCSDCHNMNGSNAAITEYNNTGNITLTTWNESTKKIVGPTGVVPLVADWKTAFKIDYAVYNGDPNIFPSDPNAWAFLKTGSDNAHLYFAEPLDSSTLAKLGFSRFPSSVKLIDNNIPSEFALYQNYPNPFNPSTTIRFALRETGKVTVNIYDIQGRLIKSLVNNSEKSAGTYEVNWDGTDSNGNKVTSGIYFTRMSTGSFHQTQKMILMK